MYAVWCDYVQTADSRQQTADSRQQTADSRQQTADSRQQTADSRQQTADSRQQTADSRQQTADSRQQTADSRQQTLELDTPHWSFAPNPTEGFVVCCDRPSDNDDPYQLHGILTQTVGDLFFSKNIARSDFDPAKNLPFLKDSQKADLSQDKIALINLDHRQPDDLSHYATINLWSESKDFSHPRVYPAPIT